MGLRLHGRAHGGAARDFQKRKSSTAAGCQATLQCRIREEVHCGSRADDGERAPVLEVRHHFNPACADLPRERLVVAVDKAREQTVRIVWSLAHETFPGDNC